LSIHPLDEVIVQMSYGYGIWSERLTAKLMGEVLMHFVGDQFFINQFADDGYGNLVHLSDDNRQRRLVFN